MRDSWVRELVNAEGSSFSVPYSYCEEALLTPSNSSKTVAPRHRGSPYFPGDGHAVAHGGTVVVRRQTRRSSEKISVSDLDTTNAKISPRTVHAKDQMSLARVGGSMTEWAR